MKGIRILLINGQELIPRGVQGMQELQEELVQGMLEMEEDMEIIGDYASAEEVLRQPEILSPNIVLMEAKMPGMDGIEVTHRLQQKWPPCKVIMLTWHEDCLAEALEAGVAGYLFKDINSQKLIQAIRRVSHGELVIDERLKSTPQVTEGDSEHPQPEGNGSATLIREAELIIPPPVDAARLLRFIYQVEEALQATIVQQVGSWNKGTAIIILLRRVTPLVDILDGLEKMPDVKGVREKPGAKYESSIFAKKITARPENRPKKELLVTLKQASPTKQLELAGYSS